MTDELTGNGQRDERGIPIDWYVPEDMRAVYANHLVVQHTEYEFVISFFALEPPLITGSDEEKIAQLDALERVRATCVSRIVVSPGRYAAFVQTLQDNLATYLKQREDQE